MATNENRDGLKPKKRGKHEPERKSVLSGVVGSREALIRLALAPDGQVLPDVRGKAPGRGAWVESDRAALVDAIANGGLERALMRAFKGSKLTIPADLTEKLAIALERNALDRLGLEARSGNLVTGSQRIEDAARSGQVSLLLHANDAAEGGSRQLDQALRVGQEAEGTNLRGLALPAGRTILSEALGRENVVHIAIVDERAAKRVSGAISRWMEFSEPNDRTELCE
jgi:predicted RNA-binding protein YlxR (DUF448 family)